VAGANGEWTGFDEWDSNCYFEEDLLALSHLIDLAENVQVRELAGRGDGQDLFLDRGQLGTRAYLARPTGELIRR